MYNNLQYPMIQPGMNYFAGTQGFQTAMPNVQTIRPTLFGRCIQNINEVNANEVPMDGTSGFFPVNDESAIYVKTWRSDGTIKTVKYVPEKIDEPVEEIKSSEIEELKTWLDDKFKMLSGNNRTHNQNNRKEEQR